MRNDKPDVHLGRSSFPTCFFCSPLRIRIVVKYQPSSRHHGVSPLPDTMGCTKTTLLQTPPAPDNVTLVHLDDWHAGCYCSHSNTLQSHRYHGNYLIQWPWCLHQLPHPNNKRSKNEQSSTSLSKYLSVLVRWMPALVQGSWAALPHSMTVVVLKDVAPHKHHY